MVRTVLSLVVASCLLGAFPSASLAAQSKAPARPAAKPASTAIVNLNTASASDLEGLPGIGAKTAARIVEYRQKNGPAPGRGTLLARTHTTRHRSFLISLEGRYPDVAIEASYSRIDSHRTAERGIPPAGGGGWWSFQIPSARG